MLNRDKWLLSILMLGAFGIINTEMGVIGLLPFAADHFGISVSKAGLLVSVFALTVAISGPVMPLLFSGINRKTAMLAVLGLFVLANIIAAYTSNFAVAIAARIIPAIFHPIYFSAAFTIAADSVKKEESHRAVSKVFIGVSGGMVLGVPIASFLASNASYHIAMLFFALVNVIVLIATLIFFPSLPVKERLTYGEQVSVLRKPIVWLSIAAVLFLNSAIFGVYSYFAEYLKTVTNTPAKIIGLILVLFGAANMIGNVLAGRLLSKDARKSIVSFPIALGIVYAGLFFLGPFLIPAAVLTLFWGILAGIGAAINQSWITSAAPEAPDFANGLFLSSVNVGTTIGTAAGGWFISGLGTQYVVLTGFLSLVLCLAFILWRINSEHF
ncbi:MFS transporter [Metabacillus sp. FJAT-52054]|uniref:MFS transporter n=1 Tax=Metabacillus sediminis TaxID=3117746 RepID=A0ABZ2NJK0_9BACI